jgi:hypothetical protein
MGLDGSTRVAPENAESPPGILNDTLRRRLLNDDPKGKGDDVRGVGGNSARDGKLEGDMGRGEELLAVLVPAGTDIAGGA